MPTTLPDWGLHKYDVKHSKTRVTYIPDSHNFARRSLHSMPAPEKNPPRGPLGGLLPFALAGGFAALALYFRTSSFSPYLSVQPWFGPKIGSDAIYTKNVSLCPGSFCISHPYRLVRTNVIGYDLTSVETSEHGLVANLVLAGEECHAYGTDRKSLAVEVTYETNTR
jgi:hypothetical protein